MVLQVLGREGRGLVTIDHNHGLNVVLDEVQQVGYVGVAVFVQGFKLLSA